MRRKRKTALIATFTLGALLFAGSALADIRDKSGYEQLKDALKLTAVNCTENYQSFTAEISMVLKDNGQVLYSDNDLLKYDIAGGAKEEIHTTKAFTDENRTRDFYHYYDKKRSIVKSGNENDYTVTTYLDEKEEPIINKEDNPFNEERVKDMERIFDALVGSLKDQVIVTDNTDGGKVLSGKLSEGQIPALIDALASFIMKQEFNDGRGSLVHLASDVYIKEVWGTAKVNEDGNLENIMGAATVSGLDKKGLAHELGLEVSFQLSDVNTTRVTMPDLSGEKVVTREERDYDKAYKPTAEKFVGRFKNEILREQDGRFVKIGERHLEITFLDNEQVRGNYREELQEGHENCAGPFKSYTFTANFNDNGDDNNAILEGVSEQGEAVKGNIYFDGYNAKIYLSISQNLQSGGVIYNSDFRPDFD